MYYFQYLGKTYRMDATRETNHRDRLLNHSKSGNCQNNLHDTGRPHLISITSHNILAWEELLCDYGDSSRPSMEVHPWLSSHSSSPTSFPCNGQSALNGN
ncbi:N-lysine methyltransferase KMT5A [Galemys pyrenaicus]|uniref:N-lysine methyltransferase KMT5A n=1 Tax=Galemys pyrenaicus TaxID=202257 RepID=A0A8J6AGG6_GALPY|nr:N-lysine methyltransferase KMT5A [Galemys pyrenaicus]